MNTISAVVNNSTLAAVEIGPSLSMNQQRAAFYGLLAYPVAARLSLATYPISSPRAAWEHNKPRMSTAIGLGTGALFLLLCFAVLNAMAFFR